MAISGKTSVINKLATLQATFKQQLPEKIEEIDFIWSGIFMGGDSCRDLKTLHMLAHRLAGSGGTFGAMIVSVEARVLELLFKTQLDGSDKTISFPNEMRQQVNESLFKLKQAAENWEPSSIPFIRPVESNNQRDSNLIYLAEDDELLAENMIEKLEQASYQVQYFPELNAFEKAFESEVPAAIIMDIVFKEGDVAGTDVICRIKEKYKICPPVLFISVRDDIEVRLAAARAGAVRYFHKPLNMTKLIQSLDGLTARVAAKPFRILLIDDDESLLEYYGTVLRDAGMEVLSLSHALDGLKVLTSFEPDIIVLDVYMPECSGPELAQVIRQDDAWLQTPIMFLSTETDLSLQLSAMDLGGDDFLVKPVTANHLVAAVIARAKRARWAKRLNKDLLNTLRESEFQIVTLDQHAIVSVTDTAGRIIRVNDKFCEISGYTDEELIGENHRLLKSGIHSKEFYQDMWCTISHGNVWAGKICNRKKNGDEYWVEATIVPFLDEKGKPYKYVSARTDITAVRASEERYAFAVEGAGDGVWDWDMRSNEISFSKIWMEMLGYVPFELAYTFDTFIDLVHPDDKLRVQEKLQNYLEGKVEKYAIELRMRCKNESYKWVLSRGRMIGRDEAGNPLRMTGIHSDITKRKQAEQGLIDAREDAEKANHAKSQFLSSMSHELRTPMNAIMGFGQLLKMDADQPLSKIQEESVDEIVKAGDHLLELINEVLDLAKIESGRLKISLEPVFLCEIVVESVQLVLPMASKRGIEISLSFNNKIISIVEMLELKKFVWADRIRLKQVLLNLLGNAVKYNTENGKITISCNEGDNNRTRISVTDQGFGLSDKEQSQLFKAFNRIGEERSSIEGTGIGLVITKNIIELMNGSIGVTSKQRVGSTFWVELSNDIVQTRPPKKINSIVVDQTDVSESSNKRYSVLYIEDNPANLRLVRQILGRRKNIHVWSAEDSELGFELALEHKPDLILLDINLPGMNGYDVLSKLRRKEVMHDTPVIAISANAMPRDIEKGLQAGFDDYITKPLNVATLLRVVGMKLLGHSK